MLHRTFDFHDLNQLLMKLRESEFFQHMQLSITTEIFSIMHYIFLIKQLTRKLFVTKLLNLDRFDSNNSAYCLFLLETTDLNGLLVLCRFSIIFLR